jgi:hypothetical protein
MSLDKCHSPGLGRTAEHLNPYYFRYIDCENAGQVAHPTHKNPAILHRFHSLSAKIYAKTFLPSSPERIGATIDGRGAPVLGKDIFL